MDEKEKEIFVTAASKLYQRENLTKDEMYVLEDYDDMLGYFLSLTVIGRDPTLDFDISVHAYYVRKGRQWVPCTEARFFRFLHDNRIVVYKI